MAHTIFYIFIVSLTAYVCDADKSASDFKRPFKVIADLIVDENFFLLRELSAEEKASGRVDLNDPFGEKQKIRQLNRVKTAARPLSRGASQGLSIASLLPPPKSPAFSSNVLVNSGTAKPRGGSLTNSRVQQSTPVTRTSANRRQPPTVRNDGAAQTVASLSARKTAQAAAKTTKSPFINRFNKKVPSSPKNIAANPSRGERPSGKRVVVSPGRVRKITRVVRKRLRSPTRQPTTSPEFQPPVTGVRSANRSTQAPSSLSSSLFSSRPAPKNSVPSFPRVQRVKSTRTPVQRKQFATGAGDVAREFDNSISAVAAGSVRNNVILPSQQTRPGVVQLSSKKNTIPTAGVALDSEQDNTDNINSLLGNLPGGYETVVRDMSKSAFSCEGRPYGYYADMAAHCQIFHICTPVVYPEGYKKNIRHSFFCNNGTLFDQRTLSCQVEHASTPCGKSQDYYSAINYFQKFNIFDRFRQQNERKQQQQRGLSRLETIDDVEELEASLNA